MHRQRATFGNIYRGNHAATKAYYPSIQPRNNPDTHERYGLYTFQYTLLTGSSCLIVPATFDVGSYVGALAGYAHIENILYQIPMCLPIKILRCKPGPQTEWIKYKQCALVVRTAPVQTAHLTNYTRRNIRVNTRLKLSVFITGSLPGGYSKITSYMVFSAAVEPPLSRYIGPPIRNAQDEQRANTILVNLRDTLLRDISGSSPRGVAGREVRIPW